LPELGFAGKKAQKATLRQVFHGRPCRCAAGIAAVRRFGHPSSTGAGAATFAGMTATVRHLRGDDGAARRVVP